jgi:hypothetical protein
LLIDGALTTTSRGHSFFRRSITDRVESLGLEYVTLATNEEGSPETYEDTSANAKGMRKHANSSRRYQAKSFANSGNLQAY